MAQAICLAKRAGLMAQACRAVRRVEANTGQHLPSFQPHCRRPAVPGRKTVERLTNGSVYERLIN